MTLSEPLQVTLRVAAALEGLGVRYAVGGSLASSLHGIPRATADVDLVAAIRAEHVEPLLAALGDHFYADGDEIRDAVRERRSFNLIDLDTMLKIDVFPAKGTRYAREEMARACPVTLDEQGRTLVVATPEDIVLQKLAWYRSGGEISERHWRDVQGVLSVQGDSLDRAYMAEWARELGIDDLLAAAQAQAGRAPREG